MLLLSGHCVNQYIVPVSLVVDDYYDNIYLAKRVVELFRHCVRLAANVTRKPLDYA